MCLCVQIWEPGKRLLHADKTAWVQGIQPQLPWRPAWGLACAVMAKLYHGSCHKPSTLKTVLFQPHPVQYMMLLSSVYGWWNWGSGRLRNLVKAAHLVSDKARFRTQDWCWFCVYILNPHSTLHFCNHHDQDKGAHNIPGRLFGFLACLPEHVHCVCLALGWAETPWGIRWTSAHSLVPLHVRNAKPR